MILKTRPGKRLFIRSFPDRRRSAVLGDSGHRRNIQRRRKIRNNRIEQLLNPFILESGTAEDRNKFQFDRSFAQRCLDVLVRKSRSPFRYFSSR